MKYFYISLFSLLVNFSVAQTIVSTTPENRKALVEEFMGINCGNCPRGHELVADFKQQYGNSFYAISVHQGTFADPYSGQQDFRTPYGDSLAEKTTGVQFYPSGIINRVNASGGGQGVSPVSIVSWSNAVSAILAKPSPANIGIESTYYPHNGMLDVFVEVYYTADSPGTDRLQIVLLENKISYQSDYDNGAQQNYLQKHILRLPLTGINGAEITSTNQGDLYSNTFSVQVPNDLVVDSLEVLAFVGDSYYDIYNVVGQKANNFVTSVNNLTQKSTNAFSIYPNPVINEVTILSDLVDQSFEVYNIQGQIVKRFTTTNNSHSEDLSSLQNGVYFIRQSNETSFEVLRFVKQ